MSESALDAITTIETHYVAKEHAAVYLIKSNGRAAFVDTNTQLALPYMLQALEDQGLSPESVDLILVTHAHLDHSGGTAALLEKCPNAHVYTHPKAMRHMVDPSRLVAGAKVVYGEEAFTKYYGEVPGVPEDRISAVEDGQTLEWEGHQFNCFYTLGHASHHVCFHDTTMNAVFPGDNLGVGLSPLLNDGASSLFASSAPPEFNAEQARQSVQKILDTGAAAAFPTHFGRFDDLPKAAEQVLHSLDLLEACVAEGLETDLEGEALDKWGQDRVSVAIKDHIAWCGVADVKKAFEWYFGDVFLNGLGLSVAVQRARKAAAQ